MKSEDEELYTGAGYKGGAVYLSAKEKEMIRETIDTYFMSGSDSEQGDELMGKIIEKIRR